ncbi:hypothetical protein EYZ11_004327 [Aspergillus tanneri]|uniref:SnoaL-like domain-containing protein n=1 Tax=Aspergillus tanneri TaxID=1220188 RepID=A0A4S3JN72_9EURO|nr:uncharacterized protein ATNIH1004_002279 [Aspergillus tanneri]KAA8649608.1 hypothetical protein ATNIH1004_002279 [Aspergillus tanneri]THC96208.1 hypothetical protein EYZ11_004327 [Aspergillus tanneri]
MATSSPLLPSSPVISLGRNVILQPPLSRCGHGPGLVLMRPGSHAPCELDKKSLDPPPVQKWAEESYAVVQVTLDEDSKSESLDDLVRTGMEALMSLAECDKKDKFGLLVYGSTADYVSGFGEALRDVARKFTAVVSFTDWGIQGPAMLLHVAGLGKVNTQAGDHRIYSYPSAVSSGFIVPGNDDFRPSEATVAHSRSLTFLKESLDGPYFDLEKIWDEHTYYEFSDRSVEKTMATMVQEPYVNHVPTLTGGIGHSKLSNFYLNHFIFNNPDDTAIELISRTVGIDRVVDEFIFCLTHNKQIDWLIPGIPPTGKYLRIPFTSVVNIRGDRLYHEHIAWDQATVLVQLGLMPEYLPFPYALPDGRLPGPGKRFEYRVPAAGVETATKLQNEHLVASNQMFEYSIREVDA